LVRGMFLWIVVVFLGGTGCATPLISVITTDDDTVPILTEYPDIEVIPCHIRITVYARDPAETGKGGGVENLGAVDVKIIPRRPLRDDTILAKKQIQTPKWTETGREIGDEENRVCKTAVDVRVKTALELWNRILEGRRDFRIVLKVEDCGGNSVTQVFEWTVTDEHKKKLERYCGVVGR